MNPSRPPSPAPSSPLRWLSGPFRALASLQLAVALIAVYIGVLVWATVVEKLYGTPTAHFAIYNAGWFFALNALLAINVLCAVLVRFPWKRRQTGFLVTHSGILVLLAGCLTSRLGGIEAQLPIFEGQAAHRANTDQSHIELGFQLYLRKFQRKLDPGSGMASHYSSTVDFLDRGDPPNRLHENVLITLNAPVDFADPETGRTYRLFQSSFNGPWKPGDPEFDQLAGSDRSRDQIYLSRLSVNYDPGRGLKYAGSLLLVAGITMVYYMRAYFRRNGANEQQ